MDYEYVAKALVYNACIVQLIKNDINTQLIQTYYVCAY